MHPRTALFSLCATLLLAASLVTACGGTGTAVARSTTTPAGGPQTSAELFATACASCHGPSGEGGLSGVRLNRTTAGDRQAVVAVIRDGAGAMPPSSEGMSDDQVRQLADYVAGLP